MAFGLRNIVVTGAAGWLGRALFQALIHGLSERTELAKPENKMQLRLLLQPGEDDLIFKAVADDHLVTIVRGDIRDKDDCLRLLSGLSGATVFHTAGVIHPRKVSEFYKVNVDGTSNLLDAAVRCGLKRIVAVSSNSPFGANPHPDHLFDEASDYNPYMNYGRSKMLMEREIIRCQTSESIETVIVRAPWFYGPYQPVRQTLFFKMIQKGTVPIVGSGNNLRSMVYIENLCLGLILAATAARANGQIYWIADARPYSMNEIVNTVEYLLEAEFEKKCAHKRLRLPSVVSEMALVFDYYLQSLGFYHQKIHVLSEMNKTIACSIEKAREELGYEPVMELTEGMRRSLMWCIERQLL